MAADGDSAGKEGHTNTGAYNGSRRAEREELDVPAVEGSETQGENEALATAELNLPATCLWFMKRVVEEHYLAAVSQWRWPVLLLVCGFGMLCIMARAVAHWARFYLSGTLPLRIFRSTSISPACPSRLCPDHGTHVAFLHICSSLYPDDVLKEMIETLGPQILLMIVLYILVALVNQLSRKLGGVAVKQDDVLLSIVVGAAIAMLLMYLSTDFGYLYACFFLITTTSLLKVRWWVGSCTLGPQVAFACYWKGMTHLPPHTLMHLGVAWGVGVIIAYQTDYSRRQMFASQLCANVAREKALLEVKARVKAEHELEDAQAQVAQRNLQMSQEKAANEAKSEFMRVMCHEVRTPLNGCLASAEMLLETSLQDEQRDLAQIIRVSGSILLSTVSNFLDFFKLEAGKQLESVLTEVQLSALLADLHGIIQAMLGTRSEVDLRTPQMNDVPEVVLTDPDRLRGIILNLYTNAAKFTKSGFIDLDVSIVSKDYIEPPDSGYSNVTITPSDSHTDNNDVAVLKMSHWQRDKLSLKQKFMIERRSVDWTPMSQWPCWNIPQPANASENDMLKRSSLTASDMTHVVDDKDFLECHANGCMPMGIPWPIADAREGEHTTNNKKNCVPSRWLLFQVVDSGVGISEKGLESLFQDYVQGAMEDMNRPRTRAGTGLGLSICSKQVALLGGRIGAYSKLGSGSVFWFTIPLMTPADKKVQMRRRGSWTCEAVFSDSCYDEAAVVHVEPEKPVTLRKGSFPALPDFDDQKGPASKAGDRSVPGRSSCQTASDKLTEAGFTTCQASDGEHIVVTQAESAPSALPLDFAPCLSAREVTQTNCSNCVCDYKGDLLSVSNSLRPVVSSYDTDAETKTDGCQLQDKSSRLDMGLQTLDITALKGCRVLLAEDDPVSQTVAKKMLINMGVECKVVSNGKEAVEVIYNSGEGASFDVVLMDMVMPVMSGIKATELLRHKGVGIPIIAMTANALESDWEDCRAAGMNGFLTKPVLKIPLAEALVLALLEKDR